MLSLASGAGVGQQGHLACVLDGLGEQTLLLDRDTGDSAAADLPALRNKPAKRRDIFVVDDANGDGLDGSCGLAAFTHPWFAAVAAGFSCHGDVLSTLALRRQSPQRSQVG